MIETKLDTEITVEVIRDGVVINSLENQKNLILTGMLSSLKQIGSYLHVGTGNTPPTFLDTSLDNKIANSSSSSWVNGSPTLNGSTYEKESSCVYSFALGAVVGNISELGISSSTSEGVDLHTRALFKDGIGDPTTITVTALDQLVVTYIIKKHVSMIPTTSSVISGGLPIDYTIRPCIAPNADAGSSAQYCSSIYQGAPSTNLRMTVNDANRISVDPVTFIPSLIDGDGDTTSEGTHNVTTTGSGNEVVHTLTASLGEGNFQWGALTVSDGINSASNFVILQVEFNGPNYITKNNTETVTFKIKEIITQAT